VPVQHLQGIKTHFAVLAGEPPNPPRGPLPQPHSPHQHPNSLAKHTHLFLHAVMLAAADDWYWWLSGVEGAPPAAGLLLSWRSSHRIAKPVKQAKARRAEGYEIRAFLPRLLNVVPRCKEDMGPAAGCLGSLLVELQLLLWLLAAASGNLGRTQDSCYCCLVLPSCCLSGPASCMLQLHSL
jgi:hypothetical protein